jgi:hypothetical protein
MRFAQAVVHDALQISAMADEYDGAPPIGQARISLRPRLINSDRHALALALLFKPWIADQFAPPAECSPMVARAIMALLAPRQVLVTKTTHKHQAIPTGTRSALLSDETYATMACQTLLDHDVMVRLCNDQTSSTTISMTQINLVSNAKHLMRDNQRVDPFVLLGLTLLYAEDYDIRQVILPVSDVNRRPDVDLDALIGACRAVNIEPVMPLLGRSQEEIFELAGTRRQIERFSREYRGDRRSVADYAEIAALKVA